MGAWIKIRVSKTRRNQLSRYKKEREREREGERERERERQRERERERKERTAMNFTQRLDQERLVIITQRLNGKTAGKAEHDYYNDIIYSQRLIRNNRNALLSFDDGKLDGAATRMEPSPR
jgi:hypothetical protein